MQLPPDCLPACCPAAACLAAAGELLLLKELQHANICDALALLHLICCCLGSLLACGAADAPCAVLLWQLLLPLSCYCFGAAAALGLLLPFVQMLCPELWAADL